MASRARLTIGFVNGQPLMADPDESEARHGPRLPDPGRQAHQRCRQGGHETRHGSRLIDLNVRRNTSVHGEWVEVLDQDALEDAIRAPRELLGAVRFCLAAKGIDVS